ncbi:Zn-dependent exopeptidase [Panus rudis PR-1116 ss-1]|nr:Zn-dependent exopeptidase [Panus rudis PR-1116 ss-1]
MANPYSLLHDKYHPPFHGHRVHKVLNGKLAEKLFLTVPNEASSIAASRLFTAKPHLAGSPQDLITAKYFLDILQRELGITPPSEEPIFSAGTEESRNATLNIAQLTKPTAWIDTYYPVMNTPVNHSLEVLDEDGKATWKADLEEVADDTDPDAGKHAESVLAWHGLSKGGEVQGKLVYANYGRQEDYKALLEKGVSFNDTIVLVRYGGIFRGLKVKGAQELGAAGVLIFSDPRDDGTVTEKNGYLPYPYGPARNPTSVQRGSVQYLSLYPGDPTTPGYPSYENSTRTEGENIPGIPSLPISWNNAKVLLQEIESGQNRTVKLVNNVDNKVIPIWNTIGVIPGHIKDEVVVIGNHRDAWVMGAADPSSGTASIHETIRGLGALVKKGWKPLRTIVIASWDAEEYGLIGSTEWGEDFADWIDEHVVAYLNLDGSASGSRFSASASPSLAHLYRRSAESLPHPTKPGLTLWDATKDHGVLTGDNIDQEVLRMYEEEQKVADDLGVRPLGSGSDFTVFLQRIGVASGNQGFGSTLQDPVYHYHSVYDSERWMELYGDPGFFRHVAVAKHLGLVTLGLADSIVLPLNTTHYAFELEFYLDKVEAIASGKSLDVDFSSLRDSIKSLQKSSIKLDKEKIKAERQLRKIIKRIIRRRILHRNARKAICKLKKLLGKPCECPHKKAMVEVQAHAPIIASETGRKVRPRIGRYPAWLKEQRNGHPEENKPKIPRKKLEKAIKRIRNVNKKLVAFERGFIHEDGIKDREWYRHLGVAPGKWLGYGATTLPALTESLTIEQNSTLAKYEAERLKGLIDNLAQTIKP